MTRFVSIALAATAVGLAAPAVAADDGPPALCTDRPTKATAACTVPRGMVQLEADLINFTRLEQDGIKADTTLYTNPTIKFGVTDSTDIQATIAPYQTIRVHGGGTGSSSISGIGDLTLRVKQRLSAPDAKFQLAVMPFVKLPTAKRGIGNRKVEGGIIGTAQIPVAGFTLTLSPEIDALLDADGRGRHAQFVGAFNLGKALSPTVMAYAELWTAQNFDPSGTVRQYSLDGAIAWLARPTLQFDVGANLGLNRNTPDIQAYVGVSTRF